MVMSKMVVLTERENTDITDVDVTMCYILQPAARAVVDKK
jgi:hypothetical protein